MPKNKSKSSVKKRFKVTKSGKVKCSHPGRGHMHCSFNGHTSRNLRSDMVLNKTFGTLIKAMM